MIAMDALVRSASVNAGPTAESGCSQHSLYFFPLPQGQGVFRLGALIAR
jgi:hypothetical protein